MTQIPQTQDHIYNDDLLLLEAEQRQAQAEFRSIFHVLDDPDLRNYFRPIDERANQTKRRAQQAGFWAVIMTVAGLAGAASEPEWHSLPEPVPSILAIGSAALCILATIVVIQGGLYGKRKAAWLLDRLRTERLRQFHFQTFVARIDEIAKAPASDTKAVLGYRQTRRDAWFDYVKDSLERRADSKLAAILGVDARSELWLHGQEPSCVVPTQFDATPLFAAYRKLRLQSQADYANHKLRQNDWAWNFRKMSLKQQRLILNIAWLTPFGGLVLVHMCIVAFHVLGWGGPGLSTWLHIIALWLALLALGARTIEHGLAISREIERIEDYRAAISDLTSRFDHAADNTRLKVIMDMESLAFEEMRNFLRAHYEASFIL